VTADRDVEAVAAVLGEHDDTTTDGTLPPGPGRPFSCLCGEPLGPYDEGLEDRHARHRAAALLPLIREREAAAWERALREAADDIGEGDGISRFIGMDDLAAAVRAEKRAQQWLRDRAAANPYTGSEGE
jgi:hypothetical protein